MQTLEHEVPRPLITVQEKELSNVARELHDDVCQVHLNNIQRRSGWHPLSRVVAVLACILLLVFAERSYVVRELLLFVSLAGLLTFLLTNILLLGILLQSAARRLLQWNRTVNSQRAFREQVQAQAGSSEVNHALMKDLNIVKDF